MNYKEITADEYERLLKNKNDIFNKTFKNTDELIEDKKQILKTDPDAIIKKQQKDEYIEKLSDIISEKINDGKDMIDIKKIGYKTKPHSKNDYIHYIKNPNILADMIVEIYNNNPNSIVYMPKKELKLNYRQGINDYNTIKIDKDALKKNILKIRYNNGRKVNNKYLHDDMLISIQMKNSILKNTNINKLSKNEYHVYTLLSKYKNDDTNLLISSYLAGNKSTDLYNTINKNLYNKLKNNEITKQKYNNILKK